MQFLDLKASSKKKLKTLFFKKTTSKYKIILGVFLIFSIVFAATYQVLHQDTIKSTVPKEVIIDSSVLSMTAPTDSSVEQAASASINEIVYKPTKDSNQAIKIDPMIEKQLIEFVEKIKFQKNFLFPRVFIIIDDFGYNLAKATMFLTLEQSITFAILPNLPQSFLIAQTFEQHHKSILLHMPMEAKANNNTETITLFNTDNIVDIRRKIKQSLDTVPFRVGISNHMGSSFINDLVGMSAVMEYLKQENLFFLDSKTASGQISKQLARQHQVLYYERDIFLDNFKQHLAIAQQLITAVKIAYRRGESIAIGHPYLETYQVLAVLMPRLQKKGIIFQDFSIIKSTKKN